MHAFYLQRRVLLATLTSAGFMFFAGCAMLPPPVAAPAPVAAVAKPRSAADDLLADISRLQKMSPNELALTRESAREIFERDNANFRRLFYALTIFVSPASPSDDERLMGLLEPIVTNRVVSDEAEHVLAQLAYTSAAARRRSRDEIASARSKSAVVGKRDDREPEVRALKSRVEELEKQLVALKSIDRSVSQR